MNSGDLVDTVVVVCGHGDLLVVVGDLVDLLVVVGNLVGLVVFVISAFLGKSSSSSSSELSSDMSWQEDGSGWMLFQNLALDVICNNFLSYRAKG